MDVLFLAPVPDGVTPVATAAWPALKRGDSRSLDKRNAAWSAADARKGVRVPASAIRGGVKYVDDPLAATMTPPAVFTPSLFR